MQIYEELQARGLIAQVTDEEHIREMVNNGKATFYIGFDCTADSLTAGHFMALTLMKRLQMAGNRPIALIGGGTTMIGDPSGRTDMRKMLTKEDIDHNAACFKRQMERFIDFGEGKAMMVNNADWLLNLNYVELLREVGSCFSVNNMLRAECYKQRMEKGLSFLEFNYMIMQSYDFYFMFQKYGCNMQFGGDDQWSNMLGGTELIRKKMGKDAHALTITLLTDSNGKKMGKTAGNAVWLDPNKTSPFDFYQYWRNVDDADVRKCIRMLTFLPLEQIQEMDGWEGAQLNTAKEILAYELTQMVHGTEEADKAQAAARALFAQGGVSADMPTTRLTAADMGESLTILELLVKTGLAPSKGEARRLVQQGGVMVNDEKITAFDRSFTAGDIQAGDFILKKGKKTFHRVTLEGLEMPEAMIVRKAEAADAPAVGAIYALSWQTGYKDILPKSFLAGLTPENCAPDPEKLAAGNTLVAQTDGLAGLVSFGPARGEPKDLAELYTVYTLPSHWRQGVGRKLLEAARRELQAQGWPGMFLWTLRENVRARGFYEAMGLSLTGQQREIPVAGTTAAEVQYAQRW